MQKCRDTPALVGDLFLQSRQTDEDVIRPAVRTRTGHRRPEIRQLHEERLNVRAGQPQRRGPGLFGGRALDSQQSLTLRPRPNLERRFDDDAQRTQRTAVQLGHIVAGHVLHDLAAALDERAVHAGNADADQEITHRPL